MASEANAQTVENVYVDQELQSHSIGWESSFNPSIRDYEQPNTSSASSPSFDSNQEHIPLLSPTAGDSSSTNGDSGGNGETEWDFDKEFRGLPWWKRPSVGSW